METIDEEREQGATERASTRRTRSDGRVRRRDGAGPDAPSRSEFLAEASRLLASSLDYETTLSTVAGLALPVLGGWCIVDVVEPGGGVRRLSILHPDPEMQALASELVDSWPPERDDPIGAPVVIRSRRPEVIPFIDDDLLRQVSRGEENLRILRALGIGSVVVVPLLARDRVLGAMTFISPGSGRRYSEDDLALAEDLAARCAMAIDNAWLYREARRARREAEVASRAKSQFLAMTSHEIRTPINAIIGYAQLLEMGLSGPVTPEQRVQLERIHASGQHLLGLVNEVLDLAKVESGQMTVQHESADLAEAVAMACDLVAPQVAECGLVLRRECDPGARACYLGDPDRVRQILVNLLGNACKFTDRGGTVAVRCGVAAEAGEEARVGDGGPWAFVEVEDSGIGIPPEQQRRIFEPFIQASEGPTRSREGSGLGLAIARQLARLMGGDLTVRSEAGSGSTFTLWLPVAPEVAGPAAGERRRHGREEPALKEVAQVLLDHTDALVRAYVAALRREAGMAGAAHLADAALRNNVRGFLSQVGQTMALAGERGGSVSDVLRDGGRIQQVIAQLHGAQRRRLGWDEAALQRDFHLLREVLAHEIRAIAALDGELDGALEVLSRILQQAERTSRRAWRLTSAE